MQPKEPHAPFTTKAEHATELENALCPDAPQGNMHLLELMMNAMSVHPTFPVPLQVLPEEK
jgi:hypothetical protein